MLNGIRSKDPGGPDKSSSRLSAETRRTRSSQSKEEITNLLSYCVFLIRTLRPPRLRVGSNASCIRAARTYSRAATFRRHGAGATGSCSAALRLPVHPFLVWRTYVTPMIMRPAGRDKGVAPVVSPPRCQYWRLTGGPAKCRTCAVLERPAARINMLSRMELVVLLLADICSNFGMPAARRTCCSAAGLDPLVLPATAASAEPKVVQSEPKNPGLGHFRRVKVKCHPVQNPNDVASAGVKVKSTRAGRQ